MKLSVHTKAPSSARDQYTAVTFSIEHHKALLVRSSRGTTLELGIRAQAPLTRRRFITLVRRMVREAIAHDRLRLIVRVDELAGLKGLDLDHAELLRLFTENAHMANYAYTAYKAKPQDGWQELVELVLVGQLDASARKALTVGAVVAHEVNACRDLANTPGGDMTPKLLALRIKRAARGTAVRVRVLGVREMERLKMGAVLGVARGAKEEPRFIILEYKGSAKKAPTVLVGKGVTFDTGGLSLKPADAMVDMHLDMSGGAAVAHAVIAAARLKLRVHVVALIPAVENSVSGESYRPGDVLRSMSGKTIDVLNTDAEGRLILADTLTYAERYKPALVLDVATLTGAALVALGTKASAVLTKDDLLARTLCEAGEVSGDYLWPLPLWEEYADMVRGRFGDIANIPTENARYAGVIGGGMFLAAFAENYRWAHIDIAPRMTSDKGDQLAPGAAGAPVRLLVRLLEEEKEEGK